MNELIKSIDDAIVGVLKVADWLHDFVLGMISGLLILLMVSIFTNQLNTGAVDRPWVVDPQSTYTSWQHAAVQWAVPERGGDAYTLRAQAELNE